MNQVACRDALVDLLEDYDRSLPSKSKAAWLARKLGMQLPTPAERYMLRGFGVYPNPAPDVCQIFFFSSGAGHSSSVVACRRGDPGGQQQWALPAVVEHMQDAYCGTLTAEYDHLASR